MSDPMQEIMASFFVECEELHEALIDALQTMADGEHDDETINVAFRAVHSIKGGAGAFGLDALVGFAHQLETVMDACRAGTLPISDELVSLFLRCGDMLSDLIRCARDGEDSNTEASTLLIAELAGWVGREDDTDGAEDEPIDFQPMTLDLGDLEAPDDGLLDLGTCHRSPTLLSKTRRRLRRPDQPVGCAYISARNLNFTKAETSRCFCSGRSRIWVSAKPI